MAWSPAAVSDAAVLSSLFNAIAEAEDTPERIGPETMAHELESAYTPLEERTVLARVGGEVAGYGTIYHRGGETEEVRAYIAVHVATGRRGLGLEDCITDWAIAGATDVVAESEAAKRYVCGWLYKKQEDAARRLAGRGFEAVRHWWEMERILDADIWPAASLPFDVVPWSDRHSDPTRLVHNAAFADHWGSTPMEESDWQKRMLASPGFRQDLSFIAVAGDEIIGYSYNEVYEEDWESAGRSEGWIGALGVLREWRKQGIATALLTTSLNAMRSAGLDAAMIGVDSSSPSGAQHLYKAVGFTTKTTGTTWQLAL